MENYEEKGEEMDGRIGRTWDLASLELKIRFLNQDKGLNQEVLLNKKWLEINLTNRERVSEGILNYLESTIELLWNASPQELKKKWGDENGYGQFCINDHKWRDINPVMRHNLIKVISDWMLENPKIINDIVTSSAIGGYY